MSMDKQLQAELATFEAAIGKARDSIYGTLIAHLYVEHLLNRYLKTKIPNEANLFGDRGLSFLSKIKLIKGFGEFESQLIDSLIKLNSIRNDCAHIFGHQIPDSKIKALGRTLGKEYKRILNTYPEAEVGAIVPIIWYICGRVLSFTLEAENSPRSPRRAQ